MAAGDTARTYHYRLILLGLCLTFGFSVILAQLVQYQVLRHDQLRQIADAQRDREKEVPSQRGLIADTNGYLLATNLVRWDISASPPLVVNPEGLASQLSELLALPQDQIYAALVAKKPWVLLAKDVPQPIGEAILNLQADGILCEAHQLRVYPEGELFAHVVGIVTSAGDGFYGVEGFYNQTLKGVGGKLQIEQNPVGDEIPIPPLRFNPPQEGTSLILTLDRNIQYIVAEELARALEEYKAESGTVIVMDPKSGAVLAMVSTPTSDPNHFADTGIRLLANPAVSSMWEPGSVFKIITWAAGLDSGTISPGTTWYDNGALEIGGRVIQNWDRRGHGLVTMEDGLVQSLNTVAAFISTSVGKDRFYTYLRRFGFGSLTGVDLASEGPGMVKLPGDSNWFPSELGTNSFGQGVAVTPLQMVTAVAAVANQGLLMKPYVVRQFIIPGEDGRRGQVLQVEPTIVRQAVSRETAQTLTEMLVQAVEREGAGKARIPGYRIAGKTGTAQIPTAYGYEPTDTIASFVGYAPADDPRFVVLVKLDRPKASPWGTHTAAPTFRAIAERLFAYMQIPPDEIRLAQQ